MSDLETGVTIHQALEALMAIATELGVEHGPEVDNTKTLFDRAPEIVAAIKKLKQSNEALHGEIKIMEAVQDRLSTDLEERFNQMQASLIAFVMWKCGRKTLAIDSREITDTTRFGAQQIGVKAVDKYTTQYQVRPRKGDRHGR